MSFRIGIDSLVNNNIFKNILSTSQQKDLIKSLFEYKKYNFQICQTELENNREFLLLEEIKKKKLITTLFEEPEKKLKNNEEWLSLQKIGEFDFESNKNKFLNKTIPQYRYLIGRNLKEVENDLLIRKESYKIENAFYFGKDGNNNLLTFPLDYHSKIFVLVDKNERVISIERNQIFSNKIDLFLDSCQNINVTFSHDNLFYGC